MGSPSRTNPSACCRLPAASAASRGGFAPPAPEDAVATNPARAKAVRRSWYCRPSGLSCPLREGSGEDGVPRPAAVSAERAGRCAWGRSGPARSGTARSLRATSPSALRRVPGRLFRSPASRVLRLLLVRRLDLVGRENRRRPRGDARYLPRRIQFERRRLRFTHVNLVADDFFVRKEIGRRCGRGPEPVTAPTLDRARPCADEAHRRPVPDTTRAGAREGNRDGQTRRSGRILAPLGCGEYVRAARARRPSAPRAREPKADRDTRPGERPSPTPARANEQ